jgi:UDP-glucose 4-epimerase
VIPRFATALLAGQAPTIYGDGEQSRDFTYVDNVVSANLTAADAPAEISGAFNVATGDRISLLDLVARLNRLIGSDIQPLHAPARAGDVRHSQAGIEAIRAAIGWQPVITFDEGLRRTVEHFRHG